MNQKRINWPRLISHRGAHLTVPENTLSSLRLAAESGAEWVEFDVQLSSDEEVMVFHDNSLKPMVNAKGKLSQYDAATLSEFTVTGRFSEDGVSEHIPTLREWLCLAAKLRIGINIEIKGSFLNHLLVDKTLLLLAQHWSSDLTPPLLSSFSLDTLGYLASVEQPYPYALNKHQWLQANLPKVMYNTACVSVHLNHRIVTKRRVQLLHDLGKVVCCYTVNDPALAERLFSMGVTSVFSDNVDLLK